MLKWLLNRKQKAGSAASAMPVSTGNTGGGWIRVAESRPGAWQRGEVYQMPDSQREAAIFACMTKIASDISALPLTLQKKVGGMWSDIPEGARWMARPCNGYTWAEWLEYQTLALLQRGNAFAYPERDAQGRIVNLWPCEMKVLITQDGTDLYYEINNTLNMFAGPLKNGDRLHQSDVFHVSINNIYHPKIGVGALWAAASAGLLGAEAINAAKQEWENAISPGAVVTIPGNVTEKNLQELREQLNSGYRGTEGRQKVAVLPSGFTFTAFEPKSTLSAQVINTARWSAETVCACFGIAPYLVGFGTMPQFNSGQAAQQYLQRTINPLLVRMEQRFDHITNVQANRRYRFDRSEILQLDPTSEAERLARLVGSSILTINDARASLGYDAIYNGSAPFINSAMVPINTVTGQPKPAADDTATTTPEDTNNGA